MFRWFANRNGRREAATKLYDAIVTQSRNPVFYTRCAVPDTIAGRFDMLVIHMFIVLQVLRGDKEGEALGQEVLEAFVREMDSMVRDIGVKDRNVPSEVRRLAGMFYSQILAYLTPVEARQINVLADEIRKSFRTEAGDSGVAADHLALYVFDSIKAIREMSLPLMLQGRLEFPALRGLSPNAR